MKKVTMTLFLGLLTTSFLMMGCAGKYSDVKKMNEEYIVLVENYVADLDKADNAGDTAKAINRFADGMEKIWPEMRELAEKYPELKDQSNIPEELRVTQKKADEMGAKMAGAMMKMMPYMGDPEVLKAQQRLGTIMGGK